MGEEWDGRGRYEELVKGLLKLSVTGETGGVGR